MTKKYDKSNIMRNAWEIRRRTNVTMSIAMKAAWALEKAMMQAEEDGENCGWNHKVVVKYWAKGGHDRTYVSLRIYTNAWNMKREERYGYINNLTGEMVAA